MCFTKLGEHIHHHDLGGHHDIDHAITASILATSKNLRSGALATDCLATVKNACLEASKVAFLLAIVSTTVLPEVAEG